MPVVHPPPAFCAIAFCGLAAVARSLSGGSCTDGTPPGRYRAAGCGLRVHSARCRPVNSAQRHRYAARTPNKQTNSHHCRLKVSSKPPPPVVVLTCACSNMTTSYIRMASVLRGTGTCVCVPAFLRACVSACSSASHSNLIKMQYARHNCSLLVMEVASARCRHPALHPARSW